MTRRPPAPCWKALLQAMVDALPPTDVTIEERTIPGADGDIPIAIYQPPEPAPRPGLLMIHGGGYIVGTAREDMNGIGYAEHVGCTVVSVDYRMAPEFTYREAIADCFAGLNWMFDNADALGVDCQPHCDRRGQRRGRLDRCAGALQSRP